MARFKIGDPVTYRDGAIETVLMGDPDVNGDIITVDESGVYIFRHQDALTPVPPPDPRDAVVEAAVALVAVVWPYQRPMNHAYNAFYDAVKAYQAAQT